MALFKIFTPSPILGYGYDIVEFWRTVQIEKPAAIILDSGSTDPGPYLLGTGKTLCSEESYVRDLTPILQACAGQNIKLLISSAGGAGTNSQVDYLVNIIRKITEKEGLCFNLATIKFNDNRALTKDKLIERQIIPCGPGPDLQKVDVDSAVTIVAQMGAEPFLKALEDENVDIIISGRSYDPAPFAAFCINRGVQQSSAWHMGKIMECGGLCARPKGRSMLATMHIDSFDLTPTNPAEQCTPVSVAAHTLYEKTRPDRLPGPGGVLNLDHARYEQLSDQRTVRVSGSKFIPTPVYQIKLEGAQRLGFRTIFIGGIRDPVLIKGLDEFLMSVRSITQQAFPSLGNGSCNLHFHVYGRDAVMGPLEPTPNPGHEVGLLGEIVADTQEAADALASFCRTVVLHASYPEQLSTGGNFASPLTPLEQSAGPVYKFSVYHLMDVDDPTTLFPIEKLIVGSKKSELARNINGISNNTHKISKANHDQHPFLPTWVKKSVPRERATIAEIASVVRSKNSGPFEITLDILFDDRSHFNRVKNASVLNAEVIKKKYHIQDEDILTLMFYEPALGWKCTFKRPWPQGSIAERDTFGCQQHAPLLSISVPEA